MKCVALRSGVNNRITIYVGELFLRFVSLHCIGFDSKKQKKKKEKRVFKDTRSARFARMLRRLNDILDGLDVKSRQNRAENRV